MKSEGGGMIVTNEGQEELQVDVYISLKKVISIDKVSKKIKKIESKTIRAPRSRRFFCQEM